MAEPSADAQNLIMVLVGNKWPTGDLAALRQEGDDWSQIEASIKSCIRELEQRQATYPRWPGLEDG